MLVDSGGPGGRSAVAPVCGSPASCGGPLVGEAMRGRLDQGEVLPDQVWGVDFHLAPAA
jgi:hypothetical protein